MNIKVALDWTPNTLHAGLLLAEINHYFRDQGLVVEFVNPADDQYAVAPAQRLARKEVDIAIGPSETVLSYNTLGDKSAPLIAIATMFQEDTSAIATLKTSHIMRPAQLDGKTLGSYGARFEDDIIRQLVRNDGGQGVFRIQKPNKLEMWQHLVRQDIDAAWIFLPWEGVKAEHEEGLALQTFQLRDYGIPYGYSPLLITHQDIIDEQGTKLKYFLTAVAQGWRHVIKDPGKAAQQLHRHVSQPDFESVAMLRRSLDMLSPAVLNENNQWGFMEGYHWVDFVDWMIEQQILKDVQGVPMNHAQVDSSMLYTNEFFKV